MYCCIGVQSAPPQSLGQCGTASPLACRILCDRTNSSFSRCRFSVTFVRMEAGISARKKPRNSWRKAFSSLLNRRSMTALSSKNLKQSGSTLAAADAHGDDDILGAAPFALDQGMAGHARAAHAIGVADGDRTTIDIELVLRNAEFVATVQDLAGKRFVKLP